MLTKGDIPAPSKEAPWTELYTAAVFENDRDRLSGRIAEAELEMVKRAHTLFNMPNDDNADEREKLDYALSMLRVLKSCLERDKPGRSAA